MKKMKLIIFITIATIFSFFTLNMAIVDYDYLKKNQAIKDYQVDNDLLCPIMLSSYETILGCESDSLILSNGEVFQFKERNFFIGEGPLLSAKNLKNVFFPLYSYDGQRVSDGGRHRPYKVLSSQYGASKKEIFRNLVQVDFLGTTVYFNEKNGAAAALRNVAQKLKSVFNNYNAIYLLNPQTFHYRKIAGEKHLSAHSYGIAIDLNPDVNSHYWRWDIEHHKKPEDSLIPLEIIEIFEDYGFIWGGRWVHYDSMHFEYRPEFNSFFEETGLR